MHPRRSFLTATPGVSALTTAELRLLPLLATRLSFPQIGEDLFLSRNTIESQAVSIYRKLGTAHPQPGGHPSPRTHR